MYLNNTNHSLLGLYSLCSIQTWKKSSGEGVTGEESLTRDRHVQQMLSLQRTVNKIAVYTTLMIEIQITERQWDALFIFILIIIIIIINPGGNGAVTSSPSWRPGKRTGHTNRQHTNQKERKGICWLVENKNKSRTGLEECSDQQKVSSSLTVPWSIKEKEKHAVFHWNMLQYNTLFWLKLCKWWNNIFFVQRSSLNQIRQIQRRREC